MITTRRPASRAARTVSTAVIPQSQVRIERGARLAGGGQARGSEIVAVAKPMRQEGHHAGARRAQGAGQQRRGALPVHVVVAVNQDGATLADGGGHQVGGPIEVHQ